MDDVLDSFEGGPWSRSNGCKKAKFEANASPFLGLLIRYESRGFGYEKSCRFLRCLKGWKLMF